MTVILDSPTTIQKKQKSLSLVLIGNGPAFLQTILMLEGREIIPITNNDADFLTLERLGAKPLKKDFQTASLSFIGENNFKIILISSKTHTKQILRAISNYLKPEQILIIVKKPKMSKISKHPYTYYIDPQDQFDINLWHRITALYRLAKMNEYFKSKLSNNQKTLKALIIFFGPPDPDAIASSIAFSSLFSKKLSTTYASTAKVKRIENRALISYLKLNIQDLSNVNLEDYNIIACLDAQPAFFIKAGYDIKFDICIDHHPEAGDNPPTPIIDIRKNHGACSTILAQYFFYTKKVLRKSLATALLFGIKSDTVNFTRSANQADVNMLTFLLKKVDHNILKKFEFSKIPKRGLKYFKRAYTRFILQNNYLVCHLGRVRYLDIGSIIAEHFLKIQKVTISIVSCIYRDKLIVFFRSVNDKHHAGKLANNLFEDFGIGGGHHDMGRAECNIQNLPYPQKHIEKTIIEYISYITQNKKKDEV